MAKICGVNKTLFDKYEFDDHIWFQNKATRSDYLYLAQRAIKINGCYWMKKASSNHWSEYSDKDAEKEALNTWLGAKLPSGEIVDSEIIHTFFSGEEFQRQIIDKKMITSKVKVGSCPNIDHKMTIPFGPQFIKYKQSTYLNTWYDEMIDGDIKQLKLGKMVLMMMYGGLCNGDVDLSDMKNETERVYQMVVTDTYDNLEFRFLVNWLAAIVQQPGVNLQTNVWLIGPQEGLGKGTIIDIMGHILGKEFVGELNQTEVECGWTDHLVGKQLVEMNEFEASKKMSGREWGRWIKSHTIEPTLSIRQRNKTAYSVLHIGNFIGTSNNIEQTFIDANDRRNQFIATSVHPYWVSYAASIQLGYFTKKPDKVAAGLAYILEQVKVDNKLISTSFKNHLRNTISDNNSNIVEVWMNNDMTIKQGVWETSANLYEDYKNWFKINYPSDHIPSHIKWAKVMTSGQNLGIQRQVGRSGAQYLFGSKPLVTKVDLSDTIKTINEITGEDEEISLYDNDITEPEIDMSNLSELARLRAHLVKVKG